MPVYAPPGDRNAYNMPLLVDNPDYPIITGTGFDPKTSFTNSTLSMAQIYRLNGKPELAYTSSKNKDMERLGDKGMPAYFIKHLNPCVYRNVSGI